jgi:site-specific recombinase XerD
MSQIEHRSTRRRRAGHSSQLRIKKTAHWSPSAERLHRKYERHLDCVAGLVDRTRRLYWAYIWSFLQWRFGRRRLQLRALKPGDIADFIQARAASLQSSTLHGLATALRSFFSFLHFTGRVREPLGDAVFCPLPRPPRRIPATLSDAELQRFLKAFDQSHPIGRRDFAMALCLCRLGMRAQEVASLRLDDIDYENRTVHLRVTKARPGRLLPMSAELARAVRAYLRVGRPATDSPGLFVRHRSPWTAGHGSELVRMAMRRAYRRAKLKPRGVHILRHTLATRLHRRGTGLKAIADVLGHRSLDTTARYARINYAELRQAALPWPGE